jgi:hypothetical protein
VEVYAVDLKCPEAPAYRCKAKSAALLEKLEASVLIKEAWVNKSGTILIIVPAGSGETDAVRIMREEGLAPTPLSGSSRQASVRDYPDLRWWARRDRVSPLKPVDARDVSHAIVKRVAARVAAGPEEVLAIRRAVTNRFLAAFDRDELTTEEEIATAVLDDTAGDLAPPTRRALATALADGLRPLPDEIVKSSD